MPKVGVSARDLCHNMNPETVIDEAKKLATKKDSYTFIRQLGRGAFGTVFLAKDHTNDDREVAIKIIKAKASLGEFVLRKKPSQVREGQHEAHILCGLRHKNVLEIVETYEFKHRLTRGLAIVTEYCSQGSLEHCLKCLTRPPVITKRLDWYEQLADGLAFIHSKDIAHRDLKPANILVDSSDNLKIGDVGLAKAIWDMQGFEIEKDVTFEKYMSSVAGSPAYMAPEVWVGRYSITCDVFSMGLMYAMIAECPDPLVPAVRYSDKNYPYGLGWLLSVEMAPRSRRATELLYLHFHTARDDEKDLMNKMLCYDAHSRPSMNEVGEDIKNIRNAYMAEQAQVRERRPPPPVPTGRRPATKQEDWTKQIPIAMLLVLLVICYVLHHYGLLGTVLSGLKTIGVYAVIIGLLLLIIVFFILVNSFNVFDDCLKNLKNRVQRAAT